MPVDREPPPPPSGSPLYTAKLSDPRDRAAQPRARSRGRAVTRAEPTSDVTRFRGVLVATGAGAAAALAAALIASPSGAYGAPGPLSPPHAAAKLTCASCHTDAAPSLAPAPASSATLPSAIVPSSACAACHGPHGSIRSGHAAALSSGAMTCATCHVIHRSDQGVTFSPDSPPIRYAPGATRELSGLAFHPPRTVTVAIPTLASCRGCHDPASSTDPIARCLLAGQERLGDARPIICFDEHEPALPADARPSDRNRRPLPPSGVCAAQHTADRPVAWDAAREAAARAPVLRGGALSGAPWISTFAGLLAAALALVAVRGRDALIARRRRKNSAPAADAMLEPTARVRLPQIDVNTCLGCYACVDACPYDVLEINRYVAVVARPEACCGLTLCEQRCPNGSLRITDGEPIGDRPRLGADLASLDSEGVYLAGDVTGLPLIKNAIHQGAHAASAIAADLARSPRSPSPRDGALDLAIIGAGPAGISAALRAKELGLAFEVIEQGSVAQSIQSFPRGKLVFDQPLELPVTGKLWLEESTKEELLSHWLRIVRKERLPIREDTRMTAIVRDARTGLFEVTAEPRDGGPSSTIVARRVLLAIGQRGTPRRLAFDLAPDVEPRVHYHLADARSFEGRRVLVVGLGDVAMEAAIALSRQPDTAVTVIHRGDGFSRGKSRNIAETKRLVDAGRVGLRLGAAITALTPERATIRGPKGSDELAYDAVLVLIGSIPPWSVLEAAGVRRVADAAP